MALCSLLARTRCRAPAAPFSLVCVGVSALFFFPVEPASAAGLTATGNQLWTQDSVGVPGTAEHGERFGFAVAVGDFNRDGLPDLAVGVRFDDIGDGGGAVNVLYGSPLGLTGASSQLWHQDSAGIIGKAENSDSFGYSLAVGDFDNDTYDDLAIGVPLEDIGEYGLFGEGSEAGAVQVLYGGPGGLTARNQLWHQGSGGIKGEPESRDGFGTSLAAGDFDGDGFDDLAIGVPGEDLEDWGTFLDPEAGDDAGMVQVLYGSASGLSARDQTWNQGSDGLKGAVEKGDGFGSSLAAGDFDGDGRDDLAIGVPYEDVGACVPIMGLEQPFGKCDAGAVQVLYGGSGGLTSRDQLWTQDSDDIKDSSEQDDLFGFSLGVGDFDGDGRDDLAIGVTHEDFVSTLNQGKNDDDAHFTGGVQVLYGGSSGLSTRDQFWHRDSPGIKGSPTASSKDLAQFGYSLTAGDFDGDSRDDLAIGAPYHDLYPNSEIFLNDESGSVSVLYGSGSGLTARDQLWYQDVAGVLGSNELQDHFGWSLAAGDFNGDGRDDLSIGVPGEGHYSGAVQVLYAEPNPNNPPDADAGRSWTVVVGPGGTAAVTLDGSGSSDPDGDLLTFAWAWTGGSASGATPTVAFAVGVYEVTLTVNDGKGGTDEDTTTVEVLASDPGVGGSTLIFAEQPGASVAGEELDPQPVVWVVNGEGNPRLTFNGPVTLTLVDGSSCGGTLSGTTTVNAVNGVALLDGLTIDTACLDYVLHATSPDLTAAGSDPFAVLAAGTVLVVQGSMEPVSLCDPGGDAAVTVHLDNVSPDLIVVVASLSDSVWGSLAGVGTCAVPQTLPPGGSYSCSFTRSITEAGGFSESHTVTAAGTDSEAGAVSASDAFPVLVHPLPVPAIDPGPIAPVCTGGSTTLDAGAGDSYLWSTGEITQTISVSASGAYSVTVTDSNGCVATSEAVTAVVVPLPEPAITSTSEFPVCPGSSVELDAGAGYDSYLWSPGGETTRTITVPPTESTSYTVTVADGNGCAGSAGFQVSVRTPEPAIEATPLALDFGPVGLGLGSVQTVTVRNANCGAAEIQAELVGAAGYALVENGCQGPAIGPAETCEISVRFASSGRGASTGELLLRLASQPDAEPLRVPLLANGVALPVPAGSALARLVLIAALALVAFRRLR